MAKYALPLKIFIKDNSELKNLNKEYFESNKEFQVVNIPQKANIYIYPCTLEEYREFIIEQDNGESNTALSKAYESFDGIFIFCGKYIGDYKNYIGVKDDISDFLDRLKKIKEIPKLSGLPIVCKEFIQTFYKNIGFLSFTIESMKITDQDTVISCYQRNKDELRSLMTNRPLTQVILWASRLFDDLRYDQIAALVFTGFLRNSPTVSLDKIVPSKEMQKHVLKMLPYARQLLTSLDRNEYNVPYIIPSAYYRYVPGTGWVYDYRTIIRIRQLKTALDNPADIFKAKTRELNRIALLFELTKYSDLKKAELVKLLDTYYQKKFNPVLASEIKDEKGDIRVYYPRSGIDVEDSLPITVGQFIKTGNLKNARIEFNRRPVIMDLLE